jgi:hypothetical protein
MQYWHPPRPEGLGTRGEDRDWGSQRGYSWKRDKKQTSHAAAVHGDRRDRAVDSQRGGWYGVGLCERGRMREESVGGGLWEKKQIHGSWGL